MSLPFKITLYINPLQLLTVCQYLISWTWVWFIKKQTNQYICTHLMQDCLFLPSVQLHQRNTSLVFANIKKSFEEKGTKIQASEVQMSPACICVASSFCCLSNVIYVKPLSWTYCFVLWSPHFSKVSCQSFLTRLIHDPVRTPPHPVGLFAACHSLISLFLSHWADAMSVSRIENCLSFAPKRLLVF